jgi:hypothetical protein
MTISPPCFRELEELASSAVAGAWLPLVQIFVLPGDPISLPKAAAESTLI